MSERPIECGQCKRPLKVLYKEITNDSINYTEMCADCPILEEKLHGEPYKSEKKGQLICGNCGTSLESVQTGQPLGCMECYNVFNDFLTNELIAADALPSSVQKKLASKRTPFLHIGKSPDMPMDITLSSKLSSLNEALNEALKRENYEQAAWLRDQIKSIREKEK